MSVAAARNGSLVSALTSGKSHQLDFAFYAQVSERIARTTSVEELKHIDSGLTALRAAARLAKNPEAEANLIRLRAKARRDAGRMLEGFNIRKGRKKKVPPDEHIKILADLDISRKDSMLFSRCWRISEDEYWAGVEAQIERMRSGRNPLHSSLSDEWLTPKKIIDRVLAVLGSIDLDPCAASADPLNVPAQTCIARPDDGLAANWRGNLFLNPPYGRSVDDWCEKLIREWKVAHVTSAIALVAARPDTRWFRMFRFAPVCFIAGRLKFRRPSRSEAESAPFPSAVFYLGAEKKRFIGAFAQLGEIRDAAVAG
jgi:DNA N-6-adenine-methyltransferase (Dam)